MDNNTIKQVYDNADTLASSINAYLNGSINLGQTIQVYEVSRALGSTGNFYVAVLLESVKNKLVKFYFASSNPRRLRFVEYIDSTSINASEYIEIQGSFDDNLFDILALLNPDNSIDDANDKLAEAEKFKEAKEGRATLIRDYITANNLDIVFKTKQVSDKSLIDHVDNIWIFYNKNKDKYWKQQSKGSVLHALTQYLKFAYGMGVVKEQTQKISKIKSSLVSDDEIPTAVIEEQAKSFAQRIAESAVFKDIGEDAGVSALLDRQKTADMAVDSFFEDSTIQQRILLVFGDSRMGKSYKINKMLDSTMNGKSPFFFPSNLGVKISRGRCVEQQEKINNENLQESILKAALSGAPFIYYTDSTLKNPGAQATMLLKNLMDEDSYHPSKSTLAPVLLIYKVDKYGLKPSNLVSIVSTKAHFKGTNLFEFSPGGSDRLPTNTLEDRILYINSDTFHTSGGTDDSLVESVKKKNVVPALRDADDEGEPEGTTLQSRLATLHGSGENSLKNKLDEIGRQHGIIILPLYSKLILIMNEDVAEMENNETLTAISNRSSVANYAYPRDFAGTNDKLDAISKVVNDSLVESLTSITKEAIIGKVDIQMRYCNNPEMKAMYGKVKKYWQGIKDISTALEDIKDVFREEATILLSRVREINDMLKFATEALADNEKLSTAVNDLATNFFVRIAKSYNIGAFNKVMYTLVNIGMIRRMLKKSNVPNKVLNVYEHQMMMTLVADFEEISSGKTTALPTLAIQKELAELAKQSEE